MLDPEKDVLQDNPNLFMNSLPERIDSRDYYRGLPYIDTYRSISQREDGQWIASQQRIFREDVDPDWYVWHRDKHTRIIYVVPLPILNPNENVIHWQIQLDNELPVALTKECIPDGFLIEKEVWHRLIKGNVPLSINIVELLDENSEEVIEEKHELLRAGKTFY